LEVAKIENMYKYIEVIEDETKEAVLRMDVTEKSDRTIERVWSGLSLNLNHDKFTITENESETELPTPISR